MRVSLPLMLTVSLALHGGVMGGFALRHFVLGTSTAQVETSTQTPTLVLLSSEETPDFHPQVVAKPEASQPVASSVPVAPASPAPESAKTLSDATPTPPPSLALEANPNAHIRALPPESVLSPTPAPHLNGHNGFVFLLDISGSMYESCAGTTRLAMARDFLSQRIRALKDGTPFAITVYAQKARNSGPLVAASNATREAAIRFIREDTDCGGGTNLPAGLASAMALAAGNFVLVSDGDLNTNLASLMDKARSILNPQNHGPALTIIGIAPRPQTEATSLLKSLAQLTGGVYVAEQATTDPTALLTSAKTELTTP